MRRIILFAHHVSCAFFRAMVQDTSKAESSISQVARKKAAGFPVFDIFLSGGAGLGGNDPQSGFARGPVLAFAIVRILSAESLSSPRAKKEIQKPKPCE